MREQDLGKMSKCTWNGCTNDATPRWDDGPGDWHLCDYHYTLFCYWFYEEGGAKYAPESRDLFTGKRIPPERGADSDYASYRARYTKWAVDLGKEKCDQIAKTY